MNKKVSIILPAYNVEKYLSKCIESIIKQTYKNIEIIIIDDGSTDNTYAIAEEYSKIDKRIIVFYQENSGSGPARNIGIEKSTGDYIMFVDPDDWIDKHMISDYIYLQSKFETDIILSGYYENYFINNDVKITEKKLNKKYLKNQLLVRENYLELFLEEAICAPTRILYKKEIIDKNHIRFPDLRRSQDIVFNYRYFNCIKSLYVTEKVYYHYRIQSSNYLLKLNKDYYLTISRIYTEILDLHKQWNIKITYNNLCKFNNRFLVLIGYYIESAILQDYNFEIIFNEKYLKEIVYNSKPIDIYHKLLKISFKRNNIFLIKKIIGFKIYIKKHFSNLFEKIRKIKKY